MLETQDVKIGRISELKGGTPLDLAIVLQRLQALVSRVDEHSSISKEHSDRLENLENLMSTMVDELIAIRKILSSPSGSESKPEAADSE